ncbi:hypothetical protein JX266_012312 [Neoarthrinium moseri]|nr:hypothetical protein JX266_012312 [Neoarthrinium moseri]
MDSNIKPVQSAEMPVISSHVAKLVKAIDDGKTCDEIFDTLARMADTTRENDQYIPSKSLRTAFESDGSNGNPLRILLHTIPRKLLRSLALGLLAYDFYDKSSENHENHYSTGGPGTYAIGLTCEGHGGAFLSRREIVELRTCLKEYYCGFKVWQRHGDAYGTSQLTRDEARSYRISMLVDDFFRTEPWDEASGDMPRPALCQGAQESDKNARATDNLAWLLSMLKKRVFLGYDGDVHQISSPILSTPTSSVFQEAHQAHERWRTGQRAKKQAKNKARRAKRTEEREWVAKGGHQTAPPAARGPAGGPQRTQRLPTPDKVPGEDEEPRGWWVLDELQDHQMSKKEQAIKKAQLHKELDEEMDGYFAGTDDGASSSRWNA